MFFKFLSASCRGVELLQYCCFNTRTQIKTMAQTQSSAKHICKSTKQCKLICCVLIYCSSHFVFVSCSKTKRQLRVLGNAHQLVFLIAATALRPLCPPSFARFPACETKPRRKHPESQTSRHNYEGGKNSGPQRIQALDRCERVSECVGAPLQSLTYFERSS